MITRTRRGKALLATGALATGLFSLGCVPPEDLPEVPPLAAPAPGTVPVEVAQQADGRIVVDSSAAVAPGTDYRYLVVGGGLAAPVEGSLGDAAQLPDGQYTAAVTATDATGLTGTGTTQFTVQDGRVAA